MLGIWSIVSPGSELLGAVLVSSLARRIAKAGKRVLLLELSPTFPALDAALGLSERVVYTLEDVGRVAPSAVFLSPEGEERILFVPLFAGDTVDASQVSSCISAAEADIVLLTADRETASVARSLSDGMLLLTRADEVYLRVASHLVGALSFDGFVLADFLPLSEEIEKEMPLTELADALALPVFGILPRTELKNTVLPQGKDFLRAVDNMAGRLLGEHIPLLCGIPIEGMRRRTFFERHTR